MNKKLISILLSVFLILILSSGYVFSKGGSSSGSFSGGGGSRSSSSSFSGGTSRSSSSSSFSGNSTSKPSSSFSGGSSSSQKSTSATTPTPRSSFDNSAKKEQSRAESKTKFDSYKENTSKTLIGNNSNSGVKNYSHSGFSNYSDARSERYISTFKDQKPTNYYTYPRTVVVYKDRYDNNFMQYATMLWLFHHWDTVDRSRFSDNKIKELEEKVKALESQGIKRDPNYVQPGVDKDLTYIPTSKEENEENEENEESNVGIILVISSLCTLIIIFGCILYRIYKRRT